MALLEVSVVKRARCTLTAMRRLAWWKRTCGELAGWERLGILAVGIPLAALLAFLGSIPLSLLTNSSPLVLGTFIGSLASLAIVGLVVIDWCGQYITLPGESPARKVDDIVQQMRGFALSKYLRKDAVARDVYQRTLVERDQYVVAVSLVAKEHLKLKRSRGTEQAWEAVQERVAALEAAGTPFIEAFHLLRCMHIERERADKARKTAEMQARGGSTILGKSATASADEEEVFHNLQEFSSDLRCLKEAIASTSEDRLSEH